MASKSAWAGNSCATKARPPKYTINAAAVSSQAKAPRTNHSAGCDAGRVRLARGRSTPACQTNASSTSPAASSAASVSMASASEYEPYSM